MKKTKLLVVALLLFAQTTLTFAGDVSEKLTALKKAADERHFDIAGLQVMVIPVAGGFFANKIVVASLKAGTDSLPSEQVSQLLLQQSPIHLAITSENDGVGAATLERALISLKGKTLAPHQLVFVGEKEYEQPLTTAAEDVGLKLVHVVYP